VRRSWVVFGLFCLGSGCVAGWALAAVGQWLAFTVAFLSGFVAHDLLP
jgi:hypothetical protein